MKHYHPERGFTLLLAALVASIVLAIGAAIYSIAVKELNLSAIGRDSQFAFYAADAAAECALYWDINRKIFSTTSAPAALSCDNHTASISASSDIGDPQGGSWSRGPGTYTFTPGIDTPSNFGTLAVVVVGAGGGGGGGGGDANGSSGNDGTQDSVFDPAGNAEKKLVARVGGGGGGGKANGKDATEGKIGKASGGGKDLPEGDFDGTGGLGGPGGTPDGTASAGGAGGTGGLVIKRYADTELTPGDPVTVSIGYGGAGGQAAGGNALSGSDGIDGRVDITWTGPPVTLWKSTVFSFQTQLNGECAITYLKKYLDVNHIRTIIHADGFNVPCSATSSSPRALQRSIELRY